MRSSSCVCECWWRDVNQGRSDLSPPPPLLSVPSLDFYLTREKTSQAGFATLSLCMREKNFSRGEWGGGGFKGSLVGSVLLKPFNSDPV